MKRLSKYKWNRWGNVDVYEGTHGVAIGNQTIGYAVFTSHNKLKIDESGQVSYQQESGFVGIYDNKGKASGLVRAVDGAMSKGSKITTIVLTGGDSIKAFSQGRIKGRGRGGGLIVCSEGDEVGLTHEQSHAKLGHITIRGREKYQTRLSMEKQAVELEIRTLKEKGKYTSEVKTSIISDLSTYFRDRLSKTRLRKAREFVEKVESERAD